MRKIIVLASASLVIVALAEMPHGQTPQPPSGQPVQPSQPAPAGRGGGGDPFAGQPRIKALVVSGGCCHDYRAKPRSLMDAIGKALPVDWTVAVRGRHRHEGTMPVYDNPDWSRASTSSSTTSASPTSTDDAYIRRSPPRTHRRPGRRHPLRDAHLPRRDGRRLARVPGRDRVRHTRALNIAVKIAATDHPDQGFKTDWVTPVDELYVIDKLWPNATALATAVSPEEGTSTRRLGQRYGGDADFRHDARPRQRDVERPGLPGSAARGFKWALRRE